MKTLINTKDWCEDGWRYSMRRTVNGKRYGSAVIISKYEMHSRDIVALKLRMWRKQMREYIAKEKLLAFT